MAESKKLYRSSKDKVIFGVCGGLADYFNVDSVIMRIIFVVLALWGGSGVILYIILAIIVPEEPKAKSTAKNKSNKKTEDVIEENIEKLAKEVEGVAERHSGSGELIFGFILLLLGVTLLFNNFFPIFNLLKLWPLILILLALAILVKGAKEKR